jgi:hypothetical protein
MLLLVMQKHPLKWLICTRNWRGGTRLLSLRVAGGTLLNESDCLALRCVIFGLSQMFLIIVFLGLSYPYFQMEAWVWITWFCIEVLAVFLAAFWHGPFGVVRKLLVLLSGWLWALGGFFGLALFIWLTDAL